MTGATIVFYMVLMLPGVHPPVRMDKPSTDLAECLDDVKYILERINPEWPNGTALQAGCFLKLPDREGVKQ